MAALLTLTSCERVNDKVFEARCEASLPHALVEVETLPVEFSVDHTKSVAELTQLYPPEYPGLVLGITRAELTKDITFDNSGLEQPFGGRLCVRPRVKVVLSFKPMQVLLASDFPENTCKFNEVYNHELRHVNAYIDYLPLVAQEVQEQLTEALGTNIHYFEDSAEAQRTFETLLNSMWMPYLTAKMEQVEAEQQKIDTIEEYSRLSRACGGGQ